MPRPIEVRISDRRRRSLALVAAVARVAVGGVLAAPTVHAQGYTFNPIEVPGAIGGTPAIDVNTAGQIVRDDFDNKGTTPGIPVGVAFPAFPYLVMPLEIKNVGSGMCLDVPNASHTNGTQVQQFSCTTAKNQTWFAARARDGAVFLRTGHDGSMNLDLADGSSADHARIQIVTPFSSAQLWRIVPATDGNFEIRSAITGKCLDVVGASTASNALVQQFTCNGQTNQRWVIRPRATPMSLVVKHSAKCLDIVGPSPATNAAVQQSGCHAADNQRWFVQSAGVSDGVSYWSLVSPNGGACLDVAGGSSADHAPVQQFTCNGGQNQKWAMVDHGDDYFQIKNQQSGKCLDVVSASIEDHAAVQQFSCRDAPNQLFRWVFFQERHVQYVRTAQNDGSGLVATAPADMAVLTDGADYIYRPLGLHVVFDSASDVAVVNSSLLRRLGTGDESPGACPDGSTKDPSGCAAALARARWPDKIVVFLRPGNGQSSGNSPLIVIGEFKAGVQCQTQSDPGTPDLWWLAHELGHYLGLTHTDADFPSKADAEAALRNSGDDVRTFNFGLIGDTGPMPHWDDCASPHVDAGVIVLQGKSGPVPLLVDFSNIMGYFHTQGRTISASQSALVRAVVYARWR